MLVDIFMDKVSMKANVTQRFEDISNDHRHTHGHGGHAHQHRHEDRHDVYDSIATHIATHCPYSFVT